MLIPNGQLLVAKHITSNVTKSGAKKLSFSNLFSYGNYGMIYSDILTKFLNFLDFSLSTIATHPSKYALTFYGSIYVSIHPILDSTSGPISLIHSLYESLC